MLFFVSVQDGEIGADGIVYHGVAEQRMLPAGVITALCVLHFDNFCPEISEHKGAIFARKQSCQIDNLNTF